jgi:hypothetical protein
MIINIDFEDAIDIKQTLQSVEDFIDETDGDDCPSVIVLRRRVSEAIQTLREAGA